MTERTEGFLGELRLGRQLATTGQVSAGGLIIFLGLLFLLSGQALDSIGSSTAVASLLAALALAITLLNVLEILGGSSGPGGTYGLVYGTLGGSAGFLTAWALLAANASLTAALLRSSADHILMIFSGGPLSAALLSLFLFIFILLLQLFRLIPRRIRLWPVVLLLLLALSAVLISSLPRFDYGLIRRGSMGASGGFIRVVALLSLGYAGLEAILSSRPQVQDPERRLQPALLLALACGALILFVPQLIASGMIGPSPVDKTTGLAVVLGRAWLLPDWMAAAIAVLASLLAAGACLMTGARQVHSLSQQSLLPDRMRKIYPPFRVPPFIFALFLVLCSPLILWVPLDGLVTVSASLFLAAMVLLNLAAIRGRRPEPEGRRALATPFHPLVPSTALAISVTLFLALPAQAFAAGAIWILLGFVLYLAYGRSHLIEAQEGVLVFGREPHAEKPEGGYRILVPIGPGGERHRVLGLATSLARQMGGEIIPLQVIPIADPLAIHEGRRLARERNTLFQWSTRMTASSGVSTYPITRLAQSVARGILDTAVEEHCDLILMSWKVLRRDRAGPEGRVLDPVVRQAPCDVAVVAYHAHGDKGALGHNKAVIAPGEKAFHIDRILVPTAGGPHAPLATRLALMLASEHKATVDAVYVVDPDASQQELAEGRERIQSTLAAMRELAADITRAGGQQHELDTIPLESRLVKAESVAEGIAQAGSEADLVLIGASEESLIDQMLFGTLPEQVARSCPTPVVVVKHFRGLPRFWLKRAWDAIYEAFPTLSRREQVEVYRQIRRGARPDADYFVMMALSAVIATYGLLLGSSAVIIGAMLVAPLVTPMIAFSLAVVQGDIRLFRVALEAALKGIALAIGIAIFLTALSPLRSLTHEILSRTQPNLFDLAVALASGAAGAYALARKDVSAALPGVAIAAALLPPLSVAGIGLAMGDIEIAGGGGLLFVTNLIAVTLAGSVALLLLGFRPSPSAQRVLRLRTGLAASLILLVVISIPLAIIFARSVEESHTRQRLDQALSQELGKSPGLELVGFEFDRQDEGIYLDLTIRAQESVSTGFAESLKDSLSESLNRPVHLHLVSIPVVEIEAK